MKYEKTTGRMCGWWNTNHRGNGLQICWGDYNQSMKDYFHALSYDAGFYQDAEEVFVPGSQLYNAQKNWLHYNSLADVNAKAAILGFFDFWSETGEELGHIATTSELAQMLYNHNPNDYTYNYGTANGFELIDTVLDQSSSITITGHLDFVKAHLDPDVIREVDDALLQEQVRINDRIWLAEHHIYGSSRLGIKHYWRDQYYNNWDYAQSQTNPAVDTSRLQVKRPWYSAEYKDAIKADSTNPYGNVQTAPYKLEHTLGTKGYELNNHLGNVQAVVTDKRVVQDFDQDDSVDRYAPGLRAAYDYYPFGSFMPDRYTYDTSMHCSWVTQTKMGYVDAATGLWPEFNCFPCDFDGLGDGTIIDVENQGTVDARMVVQTDQPEPYMGGTAVTLSVTPGRETRLQMQPPEIVEGEFIWVVTEMVSGEPVELASIGLQQGENRELEFTPTQSEVQAKLISTLPGAAQIIFNPWMQVDEVLQQVNVLVRVCNDVEDKYRFGFNGQEKVNEIAGLGNHNTALFWEYATRLGRRWNRDPVVNHSVSPYAAFEGNPIWKNDVLGDDPSTHTDKDGNVVAVINDGDKGVYRHGDNADGSKPTAYQINRRQEIYGSTSANGERVGETWTDFGFADFGAFEKDGTLTPASGAKIDFGSNWATNKFQSLIDDNPSLVKYGLNAGTNGDYDFKSKVPAGETPAFGSLLFGKYASARDAGNMGAGFVAERSRIPTKVSDYGFGKYNQTGNSKVKTAIEVIGDAIDMFTPDGTGHAQRRSINSIRNSIYNGEDKLSRDGINTGKLLFKNTLSK